MSNDLEEAMKKFATEDFKFWKEIQTKLLADCTTEEKETTVKNKPNVYAISGIPPMVGDTVVSIWQYDKGVSTRALKVTGVYPDHIDATQEESNSDYGYPIDHPAGKFYFIKRAEDKYVPNY